MEGSKLAEDAVRKLTDVHILTTPAGNVARGPLLALLEEMVTAQDSGGGSGAGGPGIPLNDRAFELSQYVRRRLALMCEAYGVQPSGDLVGDLKGVWATAYADWLVSRVSASAWRALSLEVSDWVVRIEAQAEKPQVIEMTVACPECGNRWIADEEGQRSTAVTITFVTGQPPSAECRVAGCEREWTGWVEIAALSGAVGGGSERALAVMRICGLPIPGEASASTESTSADAPSEAQT